MLVGSAFIDRGVGSSAAAMLFSGTLKQNTSHHVPDATAPKMDFTMRSRRTESAVLGSGSADGGDRKQRCILIGQN